MKRHTINLTLLSCCVAVALPAAPGDSGASLKGALEARAAARVQSVAPDKWSDAKKTTQTISVAPIEGKDGDSKVRVLDLFPVADAFHFTTDPKAFRGALYATYEVSEPANVLLRSQGGSGFWTFENTTSGRTVVLYTGETWDVRKTGTFSMPLPFTGWQSYTGNPLAKGVYTLVDKGIFHITDADNGRKLGVCNHYKFRLKYPVATLVSADAEKGGVRFTVADLTKYTVRIGTVAGDWARKGFVGAEVLLTDAQGDTFELAGAKVTARVIGPVVHQSALMPLAARGVVLRSDNGVDYQYRFTAEYPEPIYDIEAIEVTASAWIMGADGVLREEVVSKTVTKAESKPVELAAWLGADRRKDIRAADGKLRETRMVWMHPHYIKWWQSPTKAKLAVDKVEAMGGNVLLPGIYHNGFAFVASDLVSPQPGLPTDGDALNVMIKEAHARGMEVHPAVSCMIGGTKDFVKDSLLGQHPEWVVRDKDDKPILEGHDAVADVHRPEFRKHFIQFIAEVARKYPVDGIHLDYKRAVQLCLCQQCRDEYRAETNGGDLTKDYGKTSVQAWQEKAVGELVKGIREALNQVRPGIKLSHWGTDDPGSFSIQGRRPDLWLNNGWIDWFEISCYGEQPDPAVMLWVKNAKMVKQPDRVWPSLGMYNSAPGPNSVELNRVTVTGDGQGGGIWGRKPEALVPMFEAFRDRCKVNGFSFFDLSYTNDDILRGMKERILKEKAVPWFGKSDE